MGARNREAFVFLHRKRTIFILLFTLLGSFLAAYVCKIFAGPLSAFVAKGISAVAMNTPEPYELILIGAGLIALFGIGEIGYKVDSWLKTSRAK